MQGRRWARSLSYRGMRRKLSYVAFLSQPTLVGVLPGEGKLPIGEAVEVVFGVVNEVFDGREPAILPKLGLYLVEFLGPATAYLTIRKTPHGSSLRAQGIIPRSDLGHSPGPIGLFARG